MLLRSALAAVALLASAVTVGCAAEPASAEREGSTTSNVVSATDAAFFSRLEAKIDNCDLLTPAETRRLDAMVPPRFAFTAEVYGYVSCTVEDGKLVSAGVTIENRAGFSSADGSFTESSISAQTALNFNVRAVDVAVSASTARTVRSSQRVAFEAGESTSIGIEVSRDLKVVEVSAGADFDGESVTVAAGAAIPLPIRLSDCAGNQSVGVKVTLNVAPVPWDATARRAHDVLIDDRMNQHASMKDSGLEPELWRDACCRGTFRPGCE